MLLQLGTLLAGLRSSESSGRLRGKRRNSLSKGLACFPSMFSALWYACQRGAGSPVAPWHAAGCHPAPTLPTKPAAFLILQQRASQPEKPQKGGLLVLTVKWPLPSDGPKEEGGSSVSLSR